MDSISHYVFDLKEQVALLLSKYKELRSSNVDLDGQRMNLLKKINYLENEIKVLKKRVEVVDVVQGMRMKDGDSANFARVKVNTLIRQIDKCISLLNE